MDWKAFGIMQIVGILLSDTSPDFIAIIIVIISIIPVIISNITSTIFISTFLLDPVLRQLQLFHH